MKQILFILGYSVIVLTIFAVNVNHTNQELEKAVHAQYTEKLTNASEKLTYLQKSVSQSLLFTDRQAFTTELNTIWRLSSEIRTSLASLPLNKELSNEWMLYIGKIGDEAEKTVANQDVNGWHQKMQKVSDNLRQLSDDWAVATTVYYEQDGNFQKWQAETVDDKIEKKLSSVAKSLKTYGEADFPLSASETDWKKKQELKDLNDQEITKKEAIIRLEKYVPSLKNATIAITDSKKEAPYPFYHLQFHEGIRLGYADVTKKGGHLLSFLMERPVDDEKLTQQQILKKAKQFLNNNDIKDVRFIESRENHQAWHLTFARVNSENKAIIYADSIQLKLAKDNGELLGMNSMEYIQKEKILPQKKIPIDLNDFFANDISVADMRLVYTENVHFIQRLCYEVLAVRDSKYQETFRVVIDTETHEVLKVEYLT